MNQFEQKPNTILKIETIKTLENNEVSFCPERGGIITSLKIRGKEILYMDESTLKDPKINVKGGIPILFPNAGPIPDEIKTEEIKNLKQHGFAREQKWMGSVKDNGFEEVLISNDETKKSYPYDFKLLVKGQFEEDGSFTIRQIVENTGEKDMPVSSGLHPYFKIPSNEKNNVEFNFKGGEIAKEGTDIWANGKAVFLDNPNSPVSVDIPDIGELSLKISEDYKKIWVWSMSEKDFICIEPVMRNKGGIITEPKLIKSGEKFELVFNIALHN